MARRRTMSPRDEYGNSFVTYSNPPAVAPLSQPSLQQEKQAQQSQILKQRETGGGDVSDPGPAAADPTGYDNADNPNSPNSEGDDAGKSAQSLNTAANVLSAVSFFAPIATPVGLALRGKSNQLDASRKTDEFGKVSPARNLQMKLEEVLSIEKTGASRKAFKQMQIDNLAIDDKTIQAFINEEPEKGYRSTGNPKGSRSKVGRNESFYDGPTTRGPSPSMDTNSDMGFGGDGDTGPGSGPPGSEGQGNI